MTGGIKTVLNPVDALAEAVQKGIENTAIGFGDDMLNMSTSMGAANATYEGKLLVDIATYTYNPFHDPTVINALSQSAILYFIFLIVFILIGGSYVLISRLRPARELLGSTFKKGLTLSDYSIAVFGLIVIVPFVPFGMWGVLYFSHIVSQMMMTGILPSIMLTPDNVVLYTAMSFIYMLMSGAFIWRTLIIGLAVGYCLIIIILLAIPYTRALGAGLFTYFVVIVFMQPAVLASTCIGVGIIQYIAPSWSSNIWQMFCYLVLLVFLFVVALVFIFGPFTIMKLLGSAKNKIKLVI